jgi:DNA-binding HxlR family transcriptional regulator
MVAEVVASEQRVCSIQWSLGILGQKWVFLIIRNALRGTTKFSDFCQELKIPRDVLSTRLNALVEAGILTRDSYQEKGTRTRWEYRLTPQGEELKVVLAALQQWGEQNRPGPGAPATYVQDREGGNVTVALLADDGTRLDTDDVHLVSADVAHRINGTAG